jgi:Integrase core domain
VAQDINQLWVADMTYVPTWQGFLYLAVVTDVFSRKVVGWAFGVHMTQELVIAALDMALLTRKPQEVIHHSDQGSQYSSIAFGKSFFATLECELIDRRTWQTKAQARQAIFTWIEAWHNPRRRHSGLGQMSPINFEKRHEEKSKPREKSAQSVQNEEPKHGLTTGCFALVDKPPHCPERGKSPCPQASPMDNPGWCLAYKLKGTIAALSREPICVRGLGGSPDCVLLLVGHAISRWIVKQHGNGNFLASQCLHYFGQVIGANYQRRIDRVKVCFYRNLGESLQPDFKLLQSA